MDSCQILVPKRMQSQLCVLRQFGVRNVKGEMNRQANEKENKQKEYDLRIKCKISVKLSQQKTILEAVKHVVS